MDEGNDMLKTRLYPTNCKRTENLQAFIVNPYWVIFQKMTLLLIATVIMMILIIGCIVYQIRIIARQNKIAKIREDFFLCADSRYEKHLSAVF